MLAGAVAAFGVVLIGAALAGIAPGSVPAVVACGVACLVLPALYLASPTWRMTVVADDDGFELRTRRTSRFRVAWSEVKEVIASPETATCFVDTGDPGTCLIVPGEGAHAPYDIENKRALFDLVLASVPPSVVREVALLSRARTEEPAAESDA